MRRSTWAAALLGAAVVAGAAQHRRVAEARPASRAAAPIEARLAVVTTPHDAHAMKSAVRFVTLRAGERESRDVASIAHVEAAVVRGDVLRGPADAVAVALDTDAGRGDYGASLHIVRGDGRVTRAADGLYHASKPLCSRDGAIYIERGTAGPPPDPLQARRGELRVDALEIDAVDPASAQIHAVYTWSGYTLHLAGERGGELLVYRVAHAQADVVAVDRRTSASRVVAAVAPFARDFSVDERRGALLMSNRDAQARAWVVDSLDLATGLLTRVSSSREQAQAPFADPFVRGAAAARPLGDGFDAVTHASSDGAWLLLTHSSPGRFDEAAAVERATGVATRLGQGDERVEPLGFLDGEASRGALR